MSQLTIEERLEKEKRSMDKFLYEKDVEDLIIEIRSLKRISHCKETFFKDLTKMIKFYKDNNCTGDFVAGVVATDGGNKSRCKKLKRIYKKTKKVKRFNSRRNIK
jgi:hypothetical protein